MKRRLLSALLAMAMLLTMVPAAFAVDNEPGGETVPPVENVLINEGVAGENSATDPEPEEPTPGTLGAVLAQISAELDEAVNLPEGVEKLGVSFTLDTYRWVSGFVGAEDTWQIDPYATITPIELKATLTKDSSANLVPVYAEDASIVLEELQPNECYVVSFKDLDGKGGLSSEDAVCFKVTEDGIEFYYMNSLLEEELVKPADSDNGAVSTITIAGTLSEDFAAYISDTNVYYVTLQDALDAAEDGQTVVLNENLENVAVTVSKSNITLDLNKKTLSGQKHPGAESSEIVPAAITIGSNTTGAGKEDQP